MKKVEIIPVRAFQDNYIWAIVNHDNQTAACVDPGQAQPILAFLEQNQLNLVAILITHHHFDHTDGIRRLVRDFPAPVYGPQKEKIAKLTHPLKEGDKFEIAKLGLSLDVLEIPGHTAGHIAYYTKNILFCGDTLFTAGCGKIFEGTVKQMFNSLNRLSKLPDDTLIYCGHEYTLANLNFAVAVEPENAAIRKRLEATKELRYNNRATVPAALSIEHETNPFLRSHIPTVKSAAEGISGKQLRTPMEVFEQIRQWKNNF